MVYGLVADQPSARLTPFREPAAIDSGIWCAACRDANASETESSEARAVRVAAIRVSGTCGGGLGCRLAPLVSATASDLDRKAGFPATTDECWPAAEPFGENVLAPITVRTNEIVARVDGSAIGFRFASRATRRRAACSRASRRAPVRRAARALPARALGARLPGPRPAVLVWRGLGGVVIAGD